ncbi:hypothetical protein ACJX0J_011882, partial [Zea mays]
TIDLQSAWFILYYQIRRVNIGIDTTLATMYGFGYDTFWNCVDLIHLYCGFFYLLWVDLVKKEYLELIGILQFLIRFSIVSRFFLFFILIDYSSSKMVSCDQTTCDPEDVGTKKYDKYLGQAKKQLVVFRYILMFGIYRI